MKKLLLFMVPLLFSTLLWAGPEEPETAKKSESVWHTITLIDYKPSTNEYAKACLQKFEQASRKAGTPLPLIYWFESGKYDMVITWKLEDGPADLQGTWSPDGDTWWKALVDQEGSEEAARKLQSAYNELIETSVTQVARKAR